MDRQTWVYDIETLASCFTYTAYNIDTKKVFQAVLHKDRFELDKLIKHLKSCKSQIGFNNINFDYPIIHFILNRNPRVWNNNIIKKIDIINEIYTETQRIIDDQNPFGTAIKQNEVLIPQLDLFRLWHFNNKARTQSLKGLEIAMKFPNVQDMPISHTRNDIDLLEIDDILDYNLNDVMATYEFYLKSLDKIELRKGLNQKYNLNCANFPDSRIGEELTLKLYCQESGLDYWETKKLRSERLKIALNDCIFDYIKFESNEFNSLLNKFKSKVITETKGAVEESVIFHGFKYDFGLGGIHGCINPGIYESNSEYIIIDADVASLYPSIAVLNNLYPAHLGPEFCKVYESILKQRIAAKKVGDMTMSDGFKLSLNSVYGKSNDKYSFLYDPEYTMKTTLNGQLMLAALCERLVNAIPNLQMLQVNTDGVTVKIPIYEYETYSIICTAWEKETKLTLEYVEYSKMVIRDVNNYLAITTKGKVKYKGAFEIQKDYHKDNSFMIIPIALSEYFVKGIPIEETIKNHKDIYDFCGRQKFKGQDYGEIEFIQHNTLRREKQQKNVRYYISNKGSSFIKHYAKGSTEIINVGYQVTIFNTFINKDWKDYDINYNFYIKECYKELNQIINKQTKLF